jgi:hypothetical protein
LVELWWPEWRILLEQKDLDLQGVRIFPLNAAFYLVENEFFDPIEACELAEIPVSGQVRPLIQRVDRFFYS